MLVRRLVMDELTRETVGGYLAARDIIEPNMPLDVRELGGGVSSVVLDVRTTDRRFVVKQPLERFKVPDMWIAKRERVFIEADALDIAGRVASGNVPAVVDVDREDLVIVVDGAPPEWSNWKDLLLVGRIDVRIAERLGTLLAKWHTATQRDEETLQRFDDPEIFEQQRADPYYRTTMQRHPELAVQMGELLDRMLRTRECLVHGDYSPKNVLVGDTGLWVIDWEIAHAGDPSFDVAFMTNHLMLKAIHRPADRTRYAGCARAFWSSYGPVADPAFVLGHVGCLMVARVDGKSPAEYLTGAERAAARSLGSSFVLDPPDTLDAALRRSG